MEYQLKINTDIASHEVPDLRETVGWDRRDHEYPLVIERCNFWAGVRNDEQHLIGFGYVAGMGLQHGYMEDILVHPDYQHKGIGSALVTSLLKKAESSGLEIVTLTFDSSHAAFYESCGFTLCSGGLWRKSQGGI
ncbi:GNAT family N-acetyltransferase [Jeotgalibacillus salarius]|uniref:GNAT family N-acetyltransferase n=1 Tax=Jeotgalibacillus salarius TaxID=546023 RepID=A0A4Y8LA05_9BACL|nr:GNAT family N-acetyltransferase [Jeotgalibacillus salarius]TFD99485.1 GNAT family N-acetyltransferase [Jeotgalibacillus salarius]